MLSIFQFFNKLNDSFGIQIEYPEFEELDEAKMADAEAFANYWANQRDLADRYTKLFRQGKLDEAYAHSYFIERFGPLKHQTQSIIRNSQSKALGEARKYSKLLKGAK